MKPRVILGASALFLPMAVAGFAQQPAAKTPQDGAHAQDKAHDESGDHCLIHEKSDVLGAQVQSPAGEKLGKIEEVVLDDNGTIAYAVLSYGGILGMGDKLFAVPWDLLTPVHEAKDDDVHFALAVDKEQLKQAPGFPKDNWPDMDSEWSKSIHGFYTSTGTKGDVASTPGKAISDTAKLHLLKLDDLEGCNVKTSDDAKAGEINDVAIDLNRGQVAYVVLASGGVLGFGTDKYAVPFEALTFSVDGDEDLQCKLKVPKAKFEKAPAFDSFKTASDQPYLERLYTYYDYPFYWTASTESSMSKEQSSGK